tara:strand:+ start:44 stop:346 length:303 start_codon:yes stop_codon:yes gene_type:complete
MLGNVAFSETAISSIETASGVNVAVTGVSATGFIGTVEVDAKATVYLTGVFGTGAIGTVEIDAKATVYLTGVFGTGEVGDALVWGIIPTGGIPDWQQIST